MPVITHIRAGQQKDYYDIDVRQSDEKTVTLNVHEDVLVHNELRKGLEISEEQLDQLVSEAGSIGAYLAGVHYLSYRMRSLREMQNYLKKKGFHAGQIDYALQRLQSEKLLDDQAFAASFVRTRIRLSTKGPKMIYRELLQAGVDQSIAEEEAERLYPVDLQLAHARKYLRKKLTSVKKKKSLSEAAQVLSRLLTQRGYSREITVRVIGEIGSFLAENERDALVYRGEKALQKYKKYTGDEFVRKVRYDLYRRGFPADEIESFLSGHLNGNGSGE
ncbi:recombinase RecX [Sporolactobacillus sp. THM7-7]|nr:recombinase RecX [Sporolactobacillus sp. THM7-7]